MRILLVFLLSAGCTRSEGQVKDSLPPGVYVWQNLKPVTEASRTGRSILDGSTTSLSHFESHATTIAPGKMPHAAHKHAEEELIIVKEGKIKMTINGTSNELGPGSVGYSMPGEEHSIVNSGDKDATYYVFKYQSKTPPNPTRAKDQGGSFMIRWDTVAIAKTDKGYRRNFFNRGTSQLSKFEMHTTALNEGLDSHAPHTHQEEEIILILRGNVTMHIGDKFYPATKGDVVFLPAHIPHALMNTGKEQCEYFAFQWRNQ